MSKIVVDELITFITLKTSRDTLKALSGFSNGLKSIRKLALISVGSLTGLAYAMDKLVGGVDKQARFAEGIGLTYEQLQRFQYAAQKAHVSVEEVNSALETMAQTMTSTKPGEYNGTLLQLGIAARTLDGNIKPVLNTFDELEDRLNTLNNPTRRQQFGGQLGYSPQFTNFLSQGSAKIRADMEEAERVGAVIPEHLKFLASDYYNEQLLKLKTTIKNTATVLSIALLPAINEVLGRFEQWIIDNKDLIAEKLPVYIKAVGDGLALFGKIVVYVISKVFDLIGLFSTLSNKLDDTKVLSRSVAAAFAIMAGAFIAARAPMIFFLGSIVLIITRFYELKDLIRVIGDLMQALFPNAFKTAASAINATTKALSDLGEMIQKVSPFKISDFSSLGSLTKRAQEQVDQIKQGSSYGTFGLLNKLYQGAGGDSMGSANTTNNVTINVNGAGDPLVVANIVKRQIDLSTTAQVASPGFNRPKVT